MKKKWLELVIRTTSLGSEVVTAVLDELDLQGVVIEDRADVIRDQGREGDWDYIDESIIENMDEDVLVKGYICNDSMAKDTIRRLREKLIHLKYDADMIDLGPATMEVREVDREDWANNWKKWYKPMLIGKKVVVRPTWEPYGAKPGEVVIDMDPGMAFGNGSHETTRMCVQLLEKRLKPGMRVMDMGCGTAILGIAAAKLGAKKVVCIELDAKAAEIAAQNVALNHEEEKIEVFHGDVLQKNKEWKNAKAWKDCNLVLANIIADTIMAIAPGVHEKLTPGGVFIASGIIREREDEVFKSLESVGFVEMEKAHMGEWTAICAKKAG